MSTHNTKGMPYAILNEKGFYDLYDAKGIRVELPHYVIRITQSVTDLDKMVLICPINVVRNVDEMHKVLNP